MAFLKSLSVEGFAAFQQKLEWNNHGSLNVIIGENDTGKTHLLKLLYAISRSVEEHAKKKYGPEPKDLEELLSSKLRWTFLPEDMKLGRLVSAPRAKRVLVSMPGPRREVLMDVNHDGKLVKVELKGKRFSMPADLPTASRRLSVEVSWKDSGRLGFGFGKNTTNRIIDLDVEGFPVFESQKATFIPPKEILSIFAAIVATREAQEIAAFDDTYYDLVQDYRLPVVVSKLDQHIENVFNHLEDVTGGGEVEMLSDSSIVFRRGREIFNMHQTAEGIRKLGILSRLMKNNRITPMSGCVLFVDEPEANLHPKAIVLFAEMLHEYAQSGIQVYLSTHSYFLMKRLEQLAREHKTDYQLLDLRKGEGGGVTGQATLLAHGLPMNPIVEESLKLFDADVKLDLES